jgi:hypothetical protein
MSDAELIAGHDHLAGSTVVGVNYYLNELARRDQDRQTQTMLRYTRWITLMTGVIVVATILSLMVSLAR